MRIVCPTCDTAYDAPASAVSAGRLMRCAKCRVEWMPVSPPLAVAPAAEPAYVAPPDPASSAPLAFEDPPVAALPEQAFVSAPVIHPPLAAEPVIRAPFPDMLPARPPARPAVIAGWVASVLVLFVALWLAIAFRQAVMQHWPAAARAYAALGYK